MFSKVHIISLLEKEIATLNRICFFIAHKVSLTKFISTIDFGGQKKICLKGNIIPNYSIKTESFKFHIIHQFSYIFLNLSTVNKFIPFECWKVHIYELSIILLNNIIHMTVFVVHNC